MGKGLGKVEGKGEGSKFKGDWYGEWAARQAGASLKMNTWMATLERGRARTTTVEFRPPTTSRRRRRRIESWNLGEVPPRKLEDVVPPWRQTASKLCARWEPDSSLKLAHPLGLDEEEERGWRRVAATLD